MWPSLDDICDTLGDWGDEIGNTMDGWGDSIDLSSNPELFESFMKAYGKWEHSNLCFDEENKTVYYMW